MSQKRAKWIEGITTSRRILHDISEIVTTAIKDENGVVAKENWELIYPRPFEESTVTRGKLVKDTTDASGLRYVPTGSHEETLHLVGAELATLTIDDVIASSIVLKSMNGAVTYDLGDDFTYDVAKNAIARVEGGLIMSGADVVVTYSYNFNKILTTVPVVVEKKLTNPAADREVTEPWEVLPDRSGIRFLADPPAAQNFLLDYTEITDTFVRTNFTKVQLEPYALDLTGRTHKLVSGSKPIALKLDYQKIAEAVAGGANAVGAAPYVLDPTAKEITFATAPTLPVGGKLLLTYSEYDAATSSTLPISRALLELKAGDATKKTYKIVGSQFSVLDLQPHFVELGTENADLKVYRHLDASDAGYDSVDSKDYVINFDNPGIHFIVAQTDEFVVSFKSRGAVDLELGLSKITDRVVLKTITEPESVPTPTSDKNYGATDTATSLTMYVEITKPARLVNPETGLERYTDIRGAQIGTQDNNHYIQVRMFDRWDDSIQQPTRARYDSNGLLIDEGAFVSNWSKYAWFRDWKEYLVDELDDDAGVSNVNDGITFQEIKTTGMDENFPVQFWISTNNNRIAMILMGDPTLDQDNFLTSFAYLGRIQPFYDTKYKVRVNSGTGEIVRDTDGNPIIDEIHEYFENDVSGNFAMTTGSATLPADIGIPPKGQPIVTAVEVNYTTGSNPTLVAGELYDYTCYGYMVAYLADGGESKPSEITAGKLQVRAGLVSSGQTLPQQGISIKLKFQLPDEATGYKIYRYHEVQKTSFDAAQSIKHENFKLIRTVNKLDDDREITFIDNGSTLAVKKEDTAAGTVTLITNSWHTDYKFIQGAVPTARSFESVVRDRYTGAILSVKFSEKFGIGTGTGVTDILMFKTRSGLKYQRHSPAFITTEEFQKKEKSGQSRWTGKFHLSPIYVEHGYDKQRGWLDGVMAVDDSGIAHLDELIVDKDTPREEVYKFFRINAPYSMMNNSPNYAYGIAIVKSSLKWNN